MPYLCAYKNRTYRVLWRGQTRYGRRAHLQFMNRSGSFWVPESAIYNVRFVADVVAGDHPRAVSPYSRPAEPDSLESLDPVAYDPHDGGGSNPRGSSPAAAEDVDGEYHTTPDYNGPDEEGEYIDPYGNRIPF